MLSSFQDLQAETSAEAGTRKRFNLACMGGGGGGGGAAKLYLLCNNGHVQCFCRTREDTAEASFVFTSIKYASV